MSRLLLTGASGYIGGTLLNDLVKIPNLNVYALTRKPEQAAEVEKLGAKSVQFEIEDSKAVKDVLEEREITIVLHLSSAYSTKQSRNLIEGLHAVKIKSGLPVHFVFWNFLATSGAKIFSSHAGINRWLDDTEDVYNVQKTSTAEYPVIREAIQTCISTLDFDESLGVHSYIIVPPITYGPGEGFGNKISIQFVDIVKISKALGTVYQVPDDSYEWPVVHLKDLVSLYLLILENILFRKDIPHGKTGGYYFALNGQVKWKALYAAIASGMAQRGLVDSTAPRKPAQEDLEKMAAAYGSSVQSVHVAIGGQCALTASNSHKLGWKPVYGVDHFMSTVDEELEFTLPRL